MKVCVSLPWKDYGEDETPSLIDPLVILLRSDPSSLVRAACATALGRFLLLGEMERITRARRDQVYSALMGVILTSPPDSVVYQHALESLAYTSNEEVESLISEAYAFREYGFACLGCLCDGPQQQQTI